MASSYEPGLLGCPGISPNSYFLSKNFDVLIHMRRRASTFTEILVAVTKISATGMKIFPNEHFSPVNGMKCFGQISLAFKTGWPKWHNFALYAFPLQKYSN